MSSILDQITVPEANVTGTFIPAKKPTDKWIGNVAVRVIPEIDGVEHPEWERTEKFGVFNFGGQLTVGQGKFPSGQYSNIMLQTVIQQCATDAFNKYVADAKAKVAPEKVAETTPEKEEVAI